MKIQFSFPFPRLARDRSHRNRCLPKGCEILMLLYFACLKSSHFSWVIVVEKNCSFLPQSFLFSPVFSSIINRKIKVALYEEGLVTI